MADDDHPVGVGFPTTQKDDDPRKPEIIPVGSRYPGLLVVWVREAVGLAVPQHQGDQQALPRAVLEFDGSQVSVIADAGTSENPVWTQTWNKHACGIRFDVFRTTELTVRLYGTKSGPCRERHDVSLGTATLKPVFGDHDEWVPVTNGTGKLRIELAYIEKTELRIHTSASLQHLGYSRLEGVDQVRKFDTSRRYAAAYIQKASILAHYDVVQAFLSPINNHPFIAPLKFVAQTRSQLCLYWPFISGGFLFHHLQQARLFPLDKARLYTAEILCALERLHEADPYYHELKPKNILLDFVGHIVICDVGLLRLETTEIETTYDPILDYLAPELLSQGVGKKAIASKWWTLGAFLHEMLTGLPPFYDEDADERRRKILSEPLNIPQSLTASAQDLLAKLLVRDPEERLGANGASEIKAHPFFHDLNWVKVSRREYEPAFKPPELAMSFEQKGGHGLDKRGEAIYRSLRHYIDQRPPSPPERESAATESRDDWELVWQHQDQTFYFFNRLTKVNEPVPAPRGSQSDEVDGTPGANAAQVRAALETALEKRYLHLIPTLLKEFDVDLTFELDLPTHPTPLEYAAKLGDVEMVRAFLNHGADATANDLFNVGGEPLAIAVGSGNEALVKMLVERTDRAPCTRALGYAVTQQNLSVVRVLLASGARCDFEDDDRSPPARATECGSPAPGPTEYMPPIVRAITVGNLEIVRVLLAHGADVNIGFHEMSTLLPGAGAFSNNRVHMSCGRPVQMAMELGNLNMVRLLLDHGADIDLAQPVWRHHHCSMIARDVYLEITARLRSAKAAMGCSD